MKIIVTTESTELWHKLVTSFDEKEITLIDSYSDLKNNLESSLVFCHQPIIDFERLADDLKNAKIESLFVFYQQCEFALASAINSGQSIDNAAIEWQEKSTALLKIQKQNRRKVKLINLDQALLNSSSFAQQMNGQDISCFNPIEYQIKSDLSLLLACQQVRQEQSLNHLNNILTASSLPVCDTTEIMIDNASVLQQSANKLTIKENLEEEIESLKNQIDEKTQDYFGVNKQLEREHAVVLALQEELALQTTSSEKYANNVKLENELLELQLASVQEELEQLYLNSETEKQEYLANETELKNKLNQSLTNLDAVKSEAELLELQLGQVQEELEEYFLANQAKNKQLDRLKSDLETVENKYAVASETIQTIKRELQVAENKYATAIKQHESEAVSLKKKNEETDKKLSNSTNLVASLNNKIASLTSAAKYKDKAHAKDLQQLKVKQIELDKQTSQLAKAKQEIDILNHNLSQTKAELAQIKSSTFWKSAEPVRRLVKAVGNVDKKKAKLQQNIGLLLTSEYFDAKWYLETYPDVAASEINPAEHYLKFGAQEGRFPSPQFDGNWYLQRYPDIADADINPLIHFIKFGISEGRSASPIMLVNQNKQK